VMQHILSNLKNCGRGASRTKDGGKSPTNNRC
jgi:hypothetical protein